MTRASATRLLFIVPAFNEEASIAAVVRELRTGHPSASVVVVDDGSTDATGMNARCAGARVVPLPFNLGIGSAVQAGLLVAAAERFDIAVQVDADGQHPATEIAKLLGPIERGEADVVIGSRFIGESAYRTPPARRIGIAIFRLINKMLTGETITDSTSGFRAFGSAAIRLLAAEYPHDYPEPEVFVFLCRNGFRVREVPVAMRPRIEGRSSITLMRSAYYMLKVPLASLVGATRRRKPAAGQIGDGARPQSTTG